MPHKRPPREVWAEIRRIIWERDKRKCKRCGILIQLKECHIDHIQSGKLGTNKFKNLRTLCRRCHVLREDGRHRGMIANALRDEIVGSDWREHVWS